MLPCVATKESVKTCCWNYCTTFRKPGLKSDLKEEGGNDTITHRTMVASQGPADSTPDIEASAVVSVDGLIMASALPLMLRRIGSAMSAAMLSLGADCW